MTPRTSVVMPVRDGQVYIEEAIDLVLRQLSRDDEILVVDDASADNTRLILARIQDPRVRILDGFARGASAARNIGLTAAVGDLVAFLDHDDLWPAGRHEAMVQALMADPQLDAVFGRIRIRLSQVEYGGLGCSIKTAIMLPARTSEMHCIAATNFAKLAVSMKNYASAKTSTSLIVCRKPAFVLRFAMSMQ